MSSTPGDLDPAERDALAASRIRHVPAEPAAITTAVRSLQGRPVYLHIDVDITDSSQLPGLRVPASTGPGLARIEDCLAGIMASASIAAACIACTWLPQHMNDQTVTKAITRLAQALGAKLEWRYPQHPG